ATQAPSFPLCSLSGVERRPPSKPQNQNRNQPYQHRQTKKRRTMGCTSSI
ncbi:hypothetical protein AB1N83_013360, partial [Pleurotus pulmonarius]